jgi:ABC-type amino acid transport substrate-binding protein
MLRRLAILMIVVLPLAAAAQDRPLRVAVEPFAPYAETTADDVWFGLAVEAWRLIAEAEGWDYDLIDARDTGALAMLEAGTADIALPVIATPARAAEFHLTAPIHTATLGVTDTSPNVVMAVLDGMMSWTFLQLVFWLSLLLLAVGAVIWLAERRTNDQFGTRPVRGLGDGFWWAGVTLTTIGYGDKAPITLLGRAVAMLWMLMGLAVSAALTAAVVALTGIQTGSAATLDDLRDTRIAVETDSGTARYLESRGMTLSRHADLQAAVAAYTEGGDIGAVAGPAEALRASLSVSRAPGTMVRDTGLRPALVTFAIADPAAADMIGPAVLDLMTREAGWRLVEDHVGGG